MFGMSDAVHMFDKGVTVADVIATEWKDGGDVNSEITRGNCQLGGLIRSDLV